MNSGSGGIKNRYRVRKTDARSDNLEPISHRNAVDASVRMLGALGLNLVLGGGQYAITSISTEDLGTVLARWACGRHVSSVSTRIWLITDAILEYSRKWRRRRRTEPTVTVRIHARNREMEANLRQKVSHGSSFNRMVEMK